MRNFSDQATQQESLSMEDSWSILSDKLVPNRFFSTFAFLFLSSITIASDFAKYRTGLIREANRTNEFLAR